MPTVELEEACLGPFQEFRDASGNGGAVPRWVFFTNHFFVLCCVADSPDLRVRDIASMVGITERATQAILGDLVRDGYLERTRIGRRNRYRVRLEAPLRHSLVSGATVGEVLDVVLSHQRLAASG